MKKAIFTLLCLLPAFTCQARTIIVDANGLGDYPTIQTAIDNSNDGDVVIVSPGTYTGQGNSDIDFNGLAITVRSTDPNDPNIVATTIIDCNGSGSDPHRGFGFYNGEDANSILDGLTITNGYAQRGGGILCDVSSPTITNCIINGNSAEYGGGICSQFHSSPIITNCTVTGNSAELGGGIYCGGENPVVNNCTIIDNTAHYKGGGMYCYGSFVITNSTIADNTLDDVGYGGGIHCSGSSDGTISNCTISGNSNAYGLGGGIWCDSGGNLKIIGCQIIGNSAGLEGGGIGSYGADMTITDCTISGNSAEFEGGGIYGIGYCTVTNCTISNNSAGWGGGGLAYCFGPITNCTITDNTASDGGGLYSCDTSITNCIISGNSAEWGGGGLLCNSAIVRNCTIVGNLADRGGAIGGFYYDSITNCIIWNNAGASQIDGDHNVTYSDVEGSYTGTGNINTDPLFVQPGYWDTNDVWVDGDYHLLECSPCVNNGDPNYVAEPNETDLDGRPRILLGQVDMGAYECPAVCRRPVIWTEPNSFEFFAEYAGAAPEYQVLQIRNLGIDMLHWEIVEDCNWLQVTPTNGTLTDQIEEITLMVDPNNMPLGHYTCSFTVSDPNAVNSPVTIQVLLRIITILRVPEQFNTIQSAIDAAVDYDIVLVADDTYTGDGNRDLDFYGKAITVKSENGPENCIIDCNGTEEQYHRGFFFHSGEDVNSVVQGFTITNGCASSFPYISGGGIYCSWDSGPTIRNCIITGNLAEADGGGIFCGWNSSPVIASCTITGNSTEWDSGGGIYCGGSPIITNCTVAGNSAKYGGGGIYCGWDSSPTITNCIIWNNAGASQIDGDPNVIYSDIEGGYTGTGNIDVDPCFVLPGYWADTSDPNIIVESNDPNAIWIEGDYHLYPFSLCIDAGDPNYLPEPSETDLDGNPRIIDGRIDMGAYEFNHIPIADAGPNQTAYAWLDGIAEVTLDGSDSNDPDGDELTYLWTWTIDPNTYEANGVTPIIELPVGEHTIELIVNDGADDSEPNYVTITVIEPIESRLWILPRTINRQSRQRRIMAWLRLPQGITKDDIDSNTPLLLYPGEIEPTRQYIFQRGRRGLKRTSIIA